MSIISKLKKTIGGLMVFVAVMATLGLPSVAKAAAGMDTMGAAKTLALNGSASQKLSSNSDEDWYKIIIKDNGLLSIVMGPSANSSSGAIEDGWHLQFMDADRNVIQHESNIKKTTTFYKRCLVPGTYYIRVYSPYYVSSANYVLKPTFTKNNQWIADRYGADTEKSINLNTTYYGNMLNNDDVDSFKFIISKNGYFTLSLGPTSDSKSEDIEDGWHYTIKDANGDTVWKDSNIKKGYTTRKLSMVPGTYYAVIHSPYYESLADYALRVNFTEDNSWIPDRLNNDTYKGIQLNKVYSGRMLGNTDNDYFSVKVPVTGYLTFNIKPDASANTSEMEDGWNYQVLDAKKNVLVEDNRIKTSHTTERKRVAAGTYYFRVYSPYYYSLAIYNVSAQFTPAEGSTALVPTKANTLSVKGKTVTIKKSKLKKKSVSIKRSKAIKVTKAIGKVKFRKLSGTKKISVSKAGKFKLKKGLKKGTYKIKVRVVAAGNKTYKRAVKDTTVKININ